nr:outer membrane beta-barrel protein [uncultured Flavobacterium sp.]
MSERNNIDRLFQEKFKDFEMAPSDKVWENIQSKMNKKEKKTNLLPFWLRLCSFAAVFLIGFSVATTFIAGPFGLKDLLIEGEKENKATDKETTATEKEAQQNTIVARDSFEKITNGAVVTTDTENSSDNPTAVSSLRNVSSSKSQSPTATNSLGNGSKNQQSETSKNSIRKDRNIIAGGSDKNTIASVGKNSDKKITSTVTGKNGTSNTGVASTTIASEKNNKEAINGKEMGITPEGIALATSTEKNFAAENKTEVSDTENVKDTDLDANFMESSQSKVAYETGHQYVSSKNTDLSNTSDSNTGKTNSVKTETTQAIQKTNLIVDVAESKTLEKGVLAVTDSLASGKETVAAKAEEDKVEEDKDKKDKKEKGTKWVVSSSFSPIYMNLNGSGSALDSKFAENSKSYQTSASYGVGLKYAINDKWAIRTGANVLNMEYNTNDLTYYYSTNGAGLEHVNENGTGSGIVIENPDPKGIAYSDDGMVTTRYKGNVNHRINYIEVPLEASYKIINKKFGIDVIGGVSSLFLNDNRVSLVSAESNTNIGEANNLNKVHFSTNVGLGLRYNFLKTLQANVEPMFKYQINTYSGAADNFKPYFFGVYTGISFSF